MALTYEQLEPIFKRVLRKYCNNKYEMHELINAVWVKGRVQKLEDIRLAKNCIDKSAIDYMRVRDGRTFQGKPNRRKRSRLRSLDQPMWSDDREITPADFTPTESPKVLDRIIAKELRNFLMTGLRPMERLTLSMLSDNFSVREIAQAAGYHPTRISQIKTAMMEKLQDKYNAVAS